MVCCNGLASPSRDIYLTLCSQDRVQIDQNPDQYKAVTEILILILLLKCFTTGNSSSFFLKRHTLHLK